MLGTDHIAVLIEDVIELLKLQLQNTADICEKRTQGIDDQERYASIAVVPVVVEQRSKASAAYKNEEEQLERIHSYQDLLFYFKHELTDKSGLFYQIYRGKINKYVNPKLPDSERENCIFTR